MKDHWIWSNISIKLGYKKCVNIYRLSKYPIKLWISISWKKLGYWIGIIIKKQYFNILKADMKIMIHVTRSHLQYQNIPVHNLQTVQFCTWYIDRLDILILFSHSSSIVIECLSLLKCLIYRNTAYDDTFSMSKSLVNSWILYWIYG